MHMNQKIRQYAQERKVKLWQVAEKLGIHDSKFSRQLRHELSTRETDRIITIIDELANEKTEGGGGND